MHISVLIPCYNEAHTIGPLIDTINLHLPDATIIVGDNNSTDTTAQIAAQKGARIISETRQGKGNMVRRLFAEAEGDVFIMLDGDGTYPIESCVPFLPLIKQEGLDMIVCKRVTTAQNAYRAGHRFGNTLFTRTLAFLFGQSFTDVLTGYRIFSRRFIKSFPNRSSGFEIETELTVHALQLRLPCREYETLYLERPENSHSKLNKWKDGARILLTIIRLFQSEKPLLFYGLFSAGMVGLAFILSIPLVMEYLATGLVPRLPTAMVIVGLIIISILCGFAGLILANLSSLRREQKYLAYLNQSK